MCISVGVAIDKWVWVRVTSGSVNVAFAGMYQLLTVGVAIDSGCGVASGSVGS